MKKHSFLLAVLLGAVQAFGQANCGCGYIIRKDGNYKASQLNVQPGQTICIQAGQYTYLRLNDLQGAPGAPIRIVNCGGLVNVLSSSYTPGIQFMNCKHVVLTGSGDASLPYGFKLNNTGTTAGSVLNVTGKSSDVEIERTEVSNNNFAGIMVKTDPGCDSSFYRGNFTMYNVKIHDNYVHDTGGEGLYIGNSFWNGGVNVTCGGQSKRVYPHEIQGLEIHHNRVERTGCEGIQYGCSPGALVHHNSVKDAGNSPFASYQDNGIQIGEGSSGLCYNNYVEDAPGGGMVILGHSGDLKLYNNVITNIGNIGIFCDNRSNSLPGTVFAMLNNTITACVNEGIKLYNENNVSTLANNVIAGVAAGKFIVFGQGATATQFNNIKTTRTDTLGFANVAATDFRLTATSPLINQGGDVSSWGVSFDFDDAPRPAGLAYDPGAFERQSSGVQRRAAPPAASPVVSSFPAVPVELLPDESGPELASARAYPSPCREQVTLEVPEGHRIEQVEVYRANGQSALKKNPLTREQRLTLEIRRLAPGSYVYQIRTQDGTLFTGRFIKQ